jgi:3-hydroxyisobutyrate dehydrogenase-like beta-hydroxyacid dehydrogenase
MSATNNNAKTVTVIGLGTMGSTLARLLLEKGYRVTVWNRSAEKAAPLVKAGAVVAATAAEAISASEIIVICVHDYKATGAIMAAAGVAAVLKDRTLVQLTSGSPKEALDSEAWANELGAAYIDGALQAAPSQMGQADTAIWVSGKADAYAKTEPVLKIFGGFLSYLGEEAGRANTMDLATLSTIYGSIFGFFHGARAIEQAGLDLSLYAKLAAGILPAFGDFIRHEGEVIRKGDFTISESPLSISVDAMDRILKQAQDAGINDEFPAYANSLLQRAAAAGYAREELAAVIKVLRKDAQPA